MSTISVKDSFVCLTFKSHVDFIKNLSTSKHDIQQLNTLLRNKMSCEESNSLSGTIDELPNPPNGENLEERKIQRCRSGRTKQLRQHLLSYTGEIKEMQESFAEFETYHSRSVHRLQKFLNTLVTGLGEADSYSDDSTGNIYSLNSSVQKIAKQRTWKKSKDKADIADHYLGNGLLPMDQIIAENDVSVRYRLALDELQEENNDLKFIVSETKAEVNELRQQLHEAKKSDDAMLEQNSQINDELEEKVECLQEQVIQGEEMITKLVNELTLATERCNLNKVLEKEIKELQNLLETKENEVSKLSQQLLSLQEENRNLKVNDELLRNHKTELEDILNREKQKLCREQKCTFQLQQDLGQADQEKEELLRDLKKIREDREKWKNICILLENSTREKEKKEMLLRTQSEEMEKERDELLAQNTKVQNLHAEARELLRLKEVENEQLKQDLRTAYDSFRKLEAKARAQQAKLMQIQEQQLQLSYLNDHLKQVNQDMAEQIRSYAEMAQEYSDLMSSHRGKFEEHEQFQIDIDRLKKQSHQSLQYIQTLTDENLSASIESKVSTHDFEGVKHQSNNGEDVEAEIFRDDRSERESSLLCTKCPSELPTKTFGHEEMKHSETEQDRFLLEHWSCHPSETNVIVTSSPPPELSMDAENSD